MSLVVGLNRSNCLIIGVVIGLNSSDGVDIGVNRRLCLCRSYSLQMLEVCTVTQQKLVLTAVTWPGIAVTVAVTICVPTVGHTRGRVAVTVLVQLHQRSCQLGSPEARSGVNDMALTSWSQYIEDERCTKFELLWSVSQQKVLSRVHTEKPLCCVRSRRLRLTVRVVVAPCFVVVLVTGQRLFHF